MDQPDAPAPLSMQKNSYESCVTLYCEILMMLEQLQVPVPEAPINTLLQATPPPVPENVPAEDGLEVMAVMPTTEPMPSEEPQFVVASEEAVLGLASPSPENLFPKTDEETLVPVEPASSALASSLSSLNAREHLELAHYFEGLKDARNFPFSTHHINRLIDQSLCFCLEAECGDKFSAVLASFWPKREEAIKALLDPNSKKLDLRPELKAEIDRLAAAHGDWLMEGRFPYASALTSLRYIAATQNAEKYFGSLLDYGLMLMLFGQDRVVGDLAVKNRLGAEGLDQEKRVEVAFRLSRLHKLRNKVISATSRLSEQHRLLLQEDVHALITMLPKLTFPASDNLKQVA